MLLLLSLYLENYEFLSLSIKEDRTLIPSFLLASRPTVLRIMKAVGNNSFS
jgi:hypothetical protein